MDGEPDGWTCDVEWDGGDSSCGELILDLRNHIRALSAGTRLLVRSKDGGSRLEIPAWCRVTGHVLLEAKHPFYLIQVGERRG